MDEQKDWPLCVGCRTPLTHTAQWWGGSAPDLVNLGMGRWSCPSCKTTDHRVAVLARDKKSAAT